jgi:hypothetical protein
MHSEVVPAMLDVDCPASGRLRNPNNYRREAAVRQ